ncbi:34-kDa subunit of RNA polymerase III (C) [Marasmius crinis-equi]|uniref:34-kDa subunit of RNA polymerase III (C) n=1 Tax=Marasmius crinis-equi TaxID=585013 RepID=A0ABR3FZ07_9AGAR
MSKRAPNENETKLHQAALSSPNKEITAKQCENVVPDSKARQDALNFLLGVGLFKSLTDKKGSLVFRAVSKEELRQSKDLTGEEDIVLGHIRVSHNEGIWTKHLKAKTNLHQTVLDRCLKTLQQKKLIKKVQSVQHPTRKIFMLEGLEPSIALTGGPWYTDNELDTEFIETLIKACFKIVQEKSSPKRLSKHERALYPISRASHYPSAEYVQKKLREARITPTELSVEHVEMLLNVLVLDGEIEKLPAFGSSMWDTNALDDDEESADERHSKKKKRKRRHSDSDSDRDSSRRKTKKKKRARSESNSNSSDSDVVIKSKSKRRKEKDDSDSDIPRSKKKTKKRRDESGSDSESSDEEGSSRRRHKRKSRKPKDSSDEDSSSSDSENENERGRRSRSKSTKRSPSPPAFSFDDYDEGKASGGVYRAIRQERLDLGWSQAPCSVCPTFEFCKADGPVNPRDCVYYGDWLVGGTVAAIEDVV